MVIAPLQASEDPLLYGGAIAFLMHVLASSCYSGLALMRDEMMIRSAYAGHPTTARLCASAGTVQDPSAKPSISISLTGAQEGQTQPLSRAVLRDLLMSTLPCPAHTCMCPGSMVPVHTRALPKMCLVPRVLPGSKRNPASLNPPILSLSFLQLQWECRAALTECLAGPSGH